MLIVIDATIVTAHSDKDQAAPTWKKTYGFHLLVVFADHHGPGGAGEALAILLRPGNAGSQALTRAFWSRRRRSCRPG